jgi:hypothetical protein
MEKAGSVDSASAFAVFFWPRHEEFPTVCPNGAGQVTIACQGGDHDDRQA